MGKENVKREDKAMTKAKTQKKPTWPERAPSRFGGIGGVKGHNIK